MWNGRKCNAENNYEKFKINIKSSWFDDVSKSTKKENTESKKEVVARSNYENNEIDTAVKLSKDVKCEAENPTK